LIDFVLGTLTKKQGYILGNPSTENEVDINYRIPYAHGMALISDELYEVWKHEMF